MDTKEGCCPVLLWIDLTQLDTTNSAVDSFTSHFSIKLLDTGNLTANKLSGNHLDGLVFEFDFPDRASLDILRKTKHQFPSIPIIMVSEQHSESLAEWALRMRLWDYMIKPVSQPRIMELHKELTELKEISKHKNQRLILHRDESIPAEYCVGEVKYSENLLKRAITYIESHLSEKITLEEMAALCGMSPFRFSRSFKKVYDANFQNYLISRRMDEAMRLLENPSSPVGDVASLVGFKDSSYFAKTFKKHTGINPVAYREKQLLKHKAQSMKHAQHALFLFPGSDE